MADIPTQGFNNIHAFSLLSIDHFLSAVKDASERSRQLLIISIFSSILVFMAWVNSLSPEYNWYKSRSEIRKNALRHFTFSNSKADSVYYPDIKKKILVNSLTSFKEYIDLNETIYYKNLRLSKKEIVQLERLLKKHELKGGILIKHPLFAPILDNKSAKRFKKYQSLISTFDFIYNHEIYDDQLLINYVNKLDEVEIEHIDLVRVPILGISFDVNYLGAYSGLTLVAMYLLLLLSLNREHSNLEVLFRRAWEVTSYHHFHFYEYISMLQVLSFPKKLFVPQFSRERLYPFFSRFALSFPLLIYLVVVTYDLITFEVGKEINSVMTFAATGISIGSLAILAFVTLRAIRRWIIMDELWSTQSIEFNFEYILEKLDEDKEKDFNQVSGAPLNKDHLNDVKLLWYLTINKILDNSKSNDTEYCINELQKYVNDVLTVDFSKSNLSSIDNKDIDIYWKLLKMWFRKEGKKSFPDKFKRSFSGLIQFCEKYKSRQTLRSA